MEFRILGPLEAVAGERAIALPRRKHRALLATLLLRAGEPVSSDRLIEDLWGESPPRTARDALQNYVSLLRKALGADVLVTRDTAYVLEIAPEQVDANRFERLANEARAIDQSEPRAEKLREALGLWRGPPLADLVYEPFAAVEIARLEELRLAATEDLIDAELELGRHVDLVPELDALIQEHPFDERLRGQLMLALYRAGRQAEALEAYRAARRVLDEELGLEPGPPLRELEQRILRHDPALGAAVRPAAQPSRRTVTVLFARGPDGDPEVIAAWLERVRASAALHGGRTTFVGDAAMAVFGAPEAHEDDALRAVRAGLELGDLRVGVSTGEVFVHGEVVTGAPVTQARQLEQAAKPGQVIVSPATVRLVRDAVRGRRMRESAAFRVEALIEGAPGIARRLRRPLVGREVELAALRRAFAQARDEGRCVVFTTFGDAGIGKTRLARELVAEVRGEATVLVGRCVSYGEGATFLPLREMIGEGFDETVESASSTGEVFLAARRRFEELAADRTLLLLFEDVHWAEPALLDLIEYLGSQAEGSILALCLSRPELLAERAGWKEVGPSLVLEPLSDGDARTLVGDGPEADRIVEIAEGNPLYVEQLVASVEEAGPEALETVPGSIEALLASRLDRLGPEERAVAQRAAVVGRRFAPAAVAALGSAEALPALENVGFVHRAGTLYRFHHVLVRDVVYAGTPKADRAKLHRRHAEWLDEQKDSSDEMVGYHLEQAADYLRELEAPDKELANEAGRRLGKAGVRAWKRGDAVAASNLLGRAVSLLPPGNPFRLDLMCEWGSALRTRGSFAEAQDVLRRTRDEGAAAGLRRVALRAEVALSYLRLLVEPTSGTDELFDSASASVPLLEEDSDDRALGRSWLYISLVSGPYRCRFAEAVPAARNALRHYERAGWPTSACLGLLASGLAAGPKPAPQAIRECEELLARADLNGQAAVLPFLGALEAMQGDLDRARQRMRRTREICAQLGQPIAPEHSCGNFEYQIELFDGDLTAAQRLLEKSHAVLEAHGERAYLATRAVMLADVLYRRGRLSEAAARLAAAQADSSDDDVVTQWRCRAVAAKLAARKGDHGRAEQLVREALALLATTDVLNHQAACLLDLREVLTLDGRVEEARSASEEALALYERKGNIAAAKQTRSLLSR
jgi:DNA-binding SARP family transcriptional activator